MTDRPIFCVSDLHMGCGNARDNFARASGGHRKEEFNQFLDYVENCNGRLFIIGDLHELWQGNMSEVLTYRMPLLNRLAGMSAVYMLGNHDIDLRHFDRASPIRLSHPLFDILPRYCNEIVNGKSILLI